MITPQRPAFGRRGFLQAAGMAGLLASMPAVARKSAATTLAEADAAAAELLPSLQQQFAAALRNNPALLAYRSAAHSEYHATALETTGRWPAQLRGSLYRNGPARHEIGSFRYQHWFDGDGMLQAYHIRDNGIEHRARLVRTHKLQEEEAAGRALYPGFGTLPPDARGTASADQVNVANISVLHHHDRLFALWEAGSAWRMDPETLATEGVHTFSEATAGAPFSAHPRLEPDGNLWNFGYVSSLKKILLWHLAPNGEVARTVCWTVIP